jgi:hypothetical protein
MITYLLDMSIMSGGAGTKEWLAAIGGSIISAYEPSFIRDLYQGPMLSSGPLTDSDIEIGRRIAKYPSSNSNWSSCSMKVNL